MNVGKRPVYPFMFRRIDELGYKGGSAANTSLSLRRKPSFRGFVPVSPKMPTEGSISQSGDIRNGKDRFHRSRHHGTADGRPPPRRRPPALRPHPSRSAQRI